MAIPLLLVSFVFGFCGESFGKGSGVIRVDSEPSGAEIYCNDVSYGLAPAVIENLSEGEHLIVARKRGYRDAYKTVALFGGQEVLTRLTLSEEPGLVLLHSTPDGADVEMDGAYQGKTPLFLPRCPLGKHRFKFRRGGYLPREMDVEVRDRIPVKVDVELAPDAAVLNISSTPPGARILLNGSDRGVTPVTLTAVPSGSNELVLKLQGFHEHKQQIVVRAGDERDMAFTLQALPAGLEVVSDPPGARVYISNRYKGETPVKLTGLDAKKLRVRVEMKGYATDARTVTVEAGLHQTEEFRLRKNSGLITVITEPAGVKVYLDGKYQGITRDSDSELVSRPMEIDLVEEGVHTLQFSKIGYFRKTVPVMISPNKVYQVREVLTEQFVPDAIVRVGDGPNDVYIGKLIEQAPNGDIKIEVNRGIIVELTADEVISVSPYRPGDQE